MKKKKKKKFADFLDLQNFWIYVKKEFVYIRIVDHSWAWNPKANDLEP